MLSSKKILEVIRNTWFTLPRGYQEPKAYPDGVSKSDSKQWGEILKEVYEGTLVFLMAQPCVYVYI